ncbi:hypothetical protein SH668x_001370 [Planctomicrobium sp. SH668]|uniref:hypothetical protein n=1 Tax=Planctomicrobium sp. SH668 TaxID=3448126 RepID=UPI003F5B384D
MNAYPYTVKPQEPAIFVELYLPRKAAFQGVLYDTLTAGFRLDKVKEHFLLADAVKKQQIQALLGKSWTVVDYKQSDIESFRRVFYGYSLYDVNGVFLKSQSPSGDAADDADENYRIAEEPSQVVRMVFKYPSADEPSAATDFLMLALQRPLAEMAQFAQLHRDEIQNVAGNDAERVFELLADLERWQMYVGLFVFGYLVYNICERILELGETSRPPLHPADLLQDEIWVTSSWSMSMNVVDWAHRHQQ